MIDQKMVDAINEQISKEIYSANLYLAMASYFNSNNYKGFSFWFRCQYIEELNHAMKMFKYILEKKGKAVMLEISKPPAEWKSPLEVFEFAYKHEQKVTGLINNLVKISESVNDNETKQMLKYFVDEQVEEEESSGGMVEKVKSAGNDKEKLTQVDLEAGKRKTPNIKI